MWHYRMAKDAAGVFGVYEKYPAVGDPNPEFRDRAVRWDLYGGPIVSWSSEEEVVKKVETYAEATLLESFPVDHGQCRTILRDLKAFEEPDILAFEAGESWVDAFLRENE